MPSKGSNIGGGGGGRAKLPLLGRRKGCSGGLSMGKTVHHEEEEERVGGGQGNWACMPIELLVDVIQRVEAREVLWPGRRQVVACAAVCRTWRKATLEVVRDVAQSARITFPISLKQPGPRESPIQCFIRRERATSTYYLYLGLSPARLADNGKLLFVARKVRRATCADFVITLATDDFSRASSMYVGKLRSNFLGTKFTIYDSQPPCTSSVAPNSCSSRRIQSKQVSPRVSAGNYSVATITYELNVLRSRGPRRMLCTMHTIPISVIQEGGKAPTPANSQQFPEENCSPLTGAMPETPNSSFSPKNLAESSSSLFTTSEPLVLENKTPRWHELLQCWCLNFKGRVTVASVKNFQLVAAAEPFDQVSSAEQEKLILQFGKIGKDIFTMDYHYPISAFQAFAICLSSFGTKPACE